MDRHLSLSSKSAKWRGFAGAFLLLVAGGCGRSEPAPTGPPPEADRDDGQPIAVTFQDEDDWPGMHGGRTTDVENWPKVDPPPRDLVIEMPDEDSAEDEAAEEDSEEKPWWRFGR